MNTETRLKVNCYTSEGVDAGDIYFSLDENDKNLVNMISPLWDHSKIELELDELEKLVEILKINKGRK